MFSLLKNDLHLSFTVVKDSTSFGDNTKILFWVDLELQALQRGRQEYIPIDSIDRFEFVAAEGVLQAIMGASTMVLYKNPSESNKEMEQAARQLNEFCGLS